MNWGLFIPWLFSKLQRNDCIHLEFFNLRICVPQLSIQSRYCKSRPSDLHLYPYLSCELLTPTANCLCKVSTWRSSRVLKLNVSLCELLLSIPITSTFYLQSSLVGKRQLHPSSCSDPILAPLVCSCPTSNSSANPVGCFLQNISIFPASSFGRVTWGP